MSDVKNGDVELGKEATLKNNKKLIAIIASSVVAIFAAILIIVGLVGGNVKTPINKFYKGMEKGSAKTLLKAFPKFMQEDMEDYITDERVDSLKDALEDECGKNAKISYKVMGKIKIDKDDLEDVQKSLEKKYEDEKKIKVSAGYEVCIKTKIKGSKDKQESFETLKVYKINGKWCILSMF